MFPFVKLLKAGLPIATAVSATAATTVLVALTKKNIEKENKDSNLVINSFEIEVDKFLEEEKLYPNQDTKKEAPEKDDSPSEDNEKELEKVKDPVNKNSIHIKVEGDQKELKVPLAPKNEVPNSNLLLPVLPKGSFSVGEQKSIEESDKEAGAEKPQEIGLEEAQVAEGGLPIKEKEIGDPKEEHDSHMLESSSDGNPAGSERREDIVDPQQKAGGDGQEEHFLSASSEESRILESDEFNSGSEQTSRKLEDSSELGVKEQNKNETTDGAKKVSEEKLKELENLRDQMSEYADKLQSLVGFFR